MAVKRTLPEADAPRAAASSSPLATLARLRCRMDFAIIHLKIIIAFAILTALSGVYVVRHFAIDTDVNALISADLPWRQRELAYKSAFPQSTQAILAVVDAPTPELAERRCDRLGRSAVATGAGFSARSRNSAVGSFFEREALLFLDMPDLTASSGPA